MADTTNPVVLSVFGLRLFAGIKALLIDGGVYEWLGITLCRE